MTLTKAKFVVSWIRIARGLRVGLSYLVLTVPGPTTVTSLMPMETIALPAMPSGRMSTVLPFRFSVIRLAPNLMHSAGPPG